MSQMNVSTPPSHDSYTLDSKISIPSRLRRDSKPTLPDRLLSKNLDCKGRQIVSTWKQTLNTS